MPPGHSKRRAKMVNPASKAPMALKRQALYATGDYALLNASQRRYVTLMANGGMSGADAARLCGYVEPYTAVSRLNQHPGVQSAIRTARVAMIEIEDAGLARDTLRGIMSDELAPAGARIRAAQLTLEMAGYYRPQATIRAADKPLSELSAADIDSEMARLRSVLDALVPANADGAQIIPPPPRSATPGAQEHAPMADSMADSDELDQEDSGQ